MKKVLRYIAMVFWGIYILVGIFGCISGDVGIGLLMVAPSILSIVVIWPEKKTGEQPQTVAEASAAHIDARHSQEQKPAEAACPPQPGADGLSYVVMDVETTGLSSAHDRIIEIALLKIVNGKEAARYETFVDPEQELPEKITALTGITKADLRGAKSETEMAKEAVAFIGELPVVGHNVMFDLEFFSASCNEAGISNRRYQYIDTCVFARDAFPNMKNYKLNTLISELHLAGHQQRHRAMDDAICTDKLFRACNSALGGGLARAKTYVAMDRREHFEAVRPADVRPTTKTQDSNHPLYGKSIVFTGTLLNISRQQAMQMAVDVGAVVRSSVSRKTNYLVVGNQDKALVGEDGMSTKEEKAYALNAEGKADIKIISEAEFLSLVGSQLV